MKLILAAAATAAFLAGPALAQTKVITGEPVPGTSTVVPVEGVKVVPPMPDPNVVDMNPTASTTVDETVRVNGYVADPSKFSGEQTDRQNAKTPSGGTVPGQEPE